MRYSAVIFDLDGTLLDTLDDLTDSVNFTMRQYGFPLKTAEQAREYIGNGISRLLELSVPEGRSNMHYYDAVRRFKEHYSKNCCKKTKPYPQIYEVLEALKIRNIKMAIVSNKADFAVKTLHNMFFEKYISVALGETDGVLRKPAPDLLLSAIDSLGVSKESSVYIGDSEVDVHTAANAGIGCISVSWGFRDTAALAASGAGIIIDAPDEILNFV